MNLYECKKIMNYFKLTYLSNNSIDYHSSCLNAFRRNLSAFEI